MRFTLHSPGTVGGIKLDWDAPVERTRELRDAMAPHDLDTLRAGVLVRGFAIGNVTYPRGTIAFRVAEGHELFLQHPLDAPAPPPPAPETPPWTVERTGSVERHRGVVAPADDGERVDVIIATRAWKLSRAKVQQLIEAGRVRVAGQPITKSNRRLRAADVIEVDADPAELDASD